MAIPRRLETKVGSNKAIIVLKLLPRYLKLLTASGIHPRDCNKGEDKTESVLQRVGRNFPTPHHRPDSKSRPLTKSNLSFSRSIIFTSTKKKNTWSFEWENFKFYETDRLMEIIRVISSKTINGSFLDWLQTKFFRKLLIRSHFINLYRWKVSVFYLKKKKKEKKRSTIL